MTSFNAASRNIGVAILISSLTSFASTQASAANFFEQLFGGGTPSSSYQPHVDIPSPDFIAPLNPLHEPSVAHRRRHLAAFSLEPVRQKTTDLMHDRTLRPGDAVVTKSGIEVYAGAETARHSMSQFVSLDDADISSKDKQKLSALDRTQVASSSVEVLREGRSASDGSSRVVSDGVPVTKGFKVTDANGKSVRYVGP